MTPVAIAARAALGAVTLACAYAAWAFSAAVATARVDPDGALARWPVDAARAGAASRLLGAGASRPQAVRAARLASAALVRNPVNAEAMRDLALARMVLGDPAGARRLALAGERLSRRDLPTQMWLIEDRVQAGDIAGALAHYDRAMRTSVESRPVLLPILAQAADDPDIARSLARYLRARPEWWADFVGQFVAVGVRPAAFRIVADGLRLDMRAPADRARLATMIARLASIGEFAAARGLYDRATGVRGTVVDGGFEVDRGLAPFDWQLVDEADRSAAREPRDGARGEALSVEGSEGKEVARQLLALAPGRYRLQARSGAVAPGTLSPPAVTLSCAGDGGALIATAPFPVGDAARGWSAPFTVPAGCRGQWLGIASATNVGYLGERAWIDDVTVQAE